MAHFNFVIPSNREELLNEADSTYYVKNLIDHANDLIVQLKAAKTAIRDDGAEFILENFDTYYSVLYLENSLQMVNIFGAYTDLHKAITSLNTSIGFLLQDKSSLENEELKTKYLNIIKMLTYVYVQIIISIETKNEIQNKNLTLLKGKKSKKDQNEIQLNLNKKAIIVELNSLVQWELSLFFDPPVVEQNLLNLIAEVCYKFLNNPAVKAEKDLRKELFSFLGTLIKNYNHGNTFCIRMIQMVKTNEYLVEILVEGIQQLVNMYNCRSLVHDLIKEIFEWVMEDQYQDSQGSSRCGQVLSRMAVLMPDLMFTEFLMNPEFVDLSITNLPFEDSLRKSIIPVITEVVLQVLTKHDLSEEETKSRDALLNILLDHIHDVSWSIRSKTIQQWARLQEEAAIPTKFTKQALERIILHLEDTSSNVRKSTIICVTTFLSHNMYSANLSLADMQEKLRLKEQHPSILKYNTVIRSKLEMAQEQWNSFLPDLKVAVEEELGKEEDKEDDENEDEDLTGVEEIIKLYLKDKKFKDAVKLFIKTAEQYKEFQELPEGPERVEKIMQMLGMMFLDDEGLAKELQIPTGADGTQELTPDDLKTFEELVFLQEAVEFLKLIDSVILTMVELLETSSMDDIKEASKFFETAYQFGLDNAVVGILAMMKQMQRNEQERRNVITSTFKSIYLMTDEKTASEHCEKVVCRLVKLLKELSFESLPHLEELISEWVSTQALDNNIIDMMWKYYTKRINTVSDEDALACCELLRMCAYGRKTVIMKNFKVVATIAFQERKDDLVSLASACKFLSAGHERVDVAAKDCPFKIKFCDPIFKELFEILVVKFFEPVPFYGEAMMAAVEFVYKLCNTPDKFCEEMIKQVINRLNEKYLDPETDEASVDKYILVRLCQLLSAVPIQLLDFLDETIYKELKRRENIRSEKRSQNNKKGKKNNSNNKSRPRASVNNSAINNSTVSNSTVAEESTLEGAQAQDDDAEFILSVLENNVVCGAGGLAKFFCLIKKICEIPDIYDDVAIQGSAVVALMRFMLISSKLCESNIRLLFTIFEKTAYDEVKVNILVHLSDLLERFPNVIDPWTPRIFERLKDPSPEIRKRAFFIVSTLILRDMIRAHSYLSGMANFLVDENPELSDMCKTFFRTLAKKENNLYNALPDIFCHLMDSSEMNDDNVHNIIKFLFELMDKTKHMENLVDRFCSKFGVTSDLRQHKHIAFCLTLITYNDKALKKLQENFSAYKHLLHDADIHASFKQILTTCGRQQKGNLKPIVDEIMANVKAVFELSEDGKLMKPPPVPKPPAKTPARKQQKRKHRD